MFSVQTAVHLSLQTSLNMKDCQQVQLAHTAHKDVTTTLPACTATCKLQHWSHARRKLQDGQPTNNHHTVHVGRA